MAYIPEQGDICRIPLHVKISGCTTTGFIMAEHLKSPDYKPRQAEFIEKLDEDTLIEVLSRINACL
ncbi:MAG: hypothetical protein PHC45_01725 [Clostridiaceae bacterium]|nr:hypothetical protein [Clostridiaceae bacterium]